MRRLLVQAVQACAAVALTLGSAGVPKNFVPVHTYLQAEQGVSLLEALWLEDLAKDRVYEFVFIASPMKMRGATASPIRPLAIPIRSK
jgi:kynurenine formamidase